MTTEALNNPKMLKLYSWEQNFVKRIQARRADEIVSIRKRGWLNATRIAQNYFWPSFLPIAVFSTFIYFGNDLTPDITISSLILFSMVRDAMNELPEFIKLYIDMQVSNRRIQ